MSARRPDPLASWESHLGNRAARSETECQAVFRVEVHRPGTDLKLAFLTGHLSAAAREPWRYSVHANLPLRRLHYRAQRSRRRRSAVEPPQYGRRARWISVTSERVRIVKMNIREECRHAQRLLDTDEGGGGSVKCAPGAPQLADLAFGLALLQHARRRERGQPRRARQRLQSSLRKGNYHDDAEFERPSATAAAGSSIS